jgi:high-affinity K+ transport system ATPase subunit B
MSFLSSLTGGMSKRKMAAMAMETNAKIAEQTAVMEKNAKRQRDLANKELKLKKTELRDQKVQNAAIQKQLEEANKIASRPDAVIPNDDGTIVTGGSSMDEALDAEKKARRGRASLRIDLATATGPATGLNAPRG